MRAFYLHGFASSAQSSKAAFLGAKLAASGVTFLAPDLNLPDFSTLTITRMIRQAEEAIDACEGPVALIGSSLGAFVAVHVAESRPDRVQRLVLLAPALDFGGNRMRDLGDRGLEEWKASDRLEVFHHAYGRIVPVHYELYADAQRYDPFKAALAMPVQVFQGRRDTVVDPASVERWSAARPNVELHMLDDDHQLLGSLDHIWEEMKQFIF
jgi:pimeloyl-ACP methyl ester carboxylesterase